MLKYSLKNKYLNIIQKIAFLIVLFSVVYYTITIFGENQGLIPYLLEKLTLKAFLTTAALCFLFFYSRSFAWSLLVKSLGVKGSYRSNLKLWFFGEITRYVPGKIWPFLSRSIFISRERRTSKEKAIVLGILDALIITVSTFLLSIPSIIKNISKFYLKAIPLVALLIIIIAFGLAFINRRFKKAVLEIVQKILRNRLSKKYFLLSVVSQIFSWLSFGYLIFYVSSLFSPLLPISVNFISAAILSWFLGFVALFAPMGLGVREGVLIILLSSYITPVAASLTAIFSRVMLIATELINMAFLLLLNFFRRQKLR